MNTNRWNNSWKLPLRRQGNIIIAGNWNEYLTFDTDEQAKEFMKTLEEPNERKEQSRLRA